MKIRSITYFLDPGWPLDEKALHKAGDFIAATRPAFETAGYEVQTSRLATVPFPLLVPGLEPDEVMHLAQTLEAAARPLGYDYVAIGPALPQHPSSYRVIPEVLAATQNVFVSGLMMLGSEGVSLPAVRACAEVIHRAASVTPDGFTNLRFAALANVPPGSPFFPAAYHAGGAPTFALATEAADLAVEAFTQAESLGQARRLLVSAVEGHAQSLTRVSRVVAQTRGVSFGGIDFSLAPFPEESRSLGTAMERLGVPAAGLHGSLAAAAILTEAIDQARFPRAGFSGLFLPVLEDAVLARRAAEGSLTVMDLLLYAAVCGTGLDTVPLPGDTPPDALAAVLLDLAVLSQRLGKPLTARLMPIPGKAAGDPTQFDFAYFANSRILPLRAAPLRGFLAGSETFNLMQHKDRDVG